jgi:signal transduction histidine kinase
MQASAEVTARGLAESDDRWGSLRDILIEADHMSRLVDDLLLLSRLDAGRLKLGQG